MRQQFTMLIPQEYSISNNRTSPIWLRRKVKDGVGALTREAAKGLYPVGSANVYVGITKRTNGLYDPVNTSDTWKPLVDELVKMGILEDDNYRRVTGPFPFHAGVDKSIPVRHMRATITLTDYKPTPF